MVGRCVDRNRPQDLAISGKRIGACQKATARFVFDVWNQVIQAVMTLGKERQPVLVLDAFAPHLLEYSTER